MATRRSMVEIRRALSSVVSARLGPSSLAESSWLAVVGSPAPVRMRSQASNSWRGLRTANRPHTATADTLRFSSGSASRNGARSSGCSAPCASQPPGQNTTGLPASAASSPERARSAGANPIMASATRSPLPSTSALVASVVDIETSPISPGFAPLSASTRSTAPAMPMARSCRVVSALALATTPRDGDQITASV